MIGSHVNQQRINRIMLTSVTVGVILANSNSIGSILSTICWGSACDTESIFDLNIFWFQVMNIWLMTAPISFLFLYFYFLLSIRMRFHLLNMALWNLHGTTNDAFQVYHIQSDDVADLVDTVSMQHNNLVDSVDIINKCYSFQVRFTRSKEYSVRFHKLILVYFI